VFRRSKAAVRGKEKDSTEKWGNLGENSGRRSRDATDKVDGLPSSGGKKAGRDVKSQD